MNDAERRRHDPAMRWIVGGKAAQGWAASSSQMCRQRSASPASCARFNLGNFLRTLRRRKDRSLTSLKEKLIKIGAKVVGRCAFQMAEVAIPRQMFQVAAHRGTAAAIATGAGMRISWVTW
jgi:hypothetical protein